MGTNVRDEIGMCRPETCHIRLIKPKKIWSWMIVARIEGDADIMIEEEIRFSPALGIVVSHQTVQGLPKNDILLKQRTSNLRMLVCSATQG